MSPREEVQRGYTRCYRAVGKAEFEDIMHTGQLRPGINTLEGKWFADTLDGARLHGETLYPGEDFYLIEVDVPDDAPSLSRRDNLDGFGPARFLHSDDLHGLKPRVVEG